MGRPFSARRCKLTDEFKIEFDFGQDGGDGERSAAISAARSRSAPARNAASRVFEHGDGLRLREGGRSRAQTCDFRSGRMILQQPIEREQMEKLLATGRTDLLHRFMSKKNRKFKAFLVKTPEGKDRLRIRAARAEAGKPPAEKPAAETAKKAAQKTRKPRQKSRRRQRADLARRPGCARPARWLDECAARLDLVAHQRGEDLVGGDARPRSAPAAGGAPAGSMVVSHSCCGIHFAQALVALDRSCDFCTSASSQSMAFA